MKKYDVVVSFAEEEKDITESIRLALELLGIKSFYYPYDKEENLGRDLENSIRLLYQNEAIVAVTIFSEAYFLKRYPLLELESIKRRLEKEPDYLIPILKGEIALPNHLKGITYVDWKDSDPKLIANIVKKRLEKKINAFFEKDLTKIKGLPKNILLNTIDRVSRFKNNNANFYYYLGLYYYCLNQSNDDLQKSIENFNQAILIRPSFHEAFFWLSKVTIEHKGINRIKYKEILQPIDWLKKALELAPNLPSYVEFTNLLNKLFFKKHGLKTPFK